jgi:hypothetical protein
MIVMIKCLNLLNIHEGLEMQYRLNAEIEQVTTSVAIGSRAVMAKVAPASELKSRFAETKHCQPNLQMTATVERTEKSTFPEGNDRLSLYYYA